MGNSNNIPTQSNTLQEYFDQFRGLASQYSDLPYSSVYSAFQRTGMYNSNPIIQNRRAKAISSLPNTINRTDLANALTNVDNNEKLIRDAAHAVWYSVYTFFKIAKTYADVLTYNWYVRPQYVDKADMKKPQFKRDYALANKFVEAMNIKAKAHEIVEKCAQEGKVFYTLRKSIDRAHNKVNYAMLQQMPSDWIKIVGFNSVSKYTVAFNMMYFLQPGTDWRQYGDLFLPYITDFMNAVSGTQSRRIDTRKYICASRNPINLDRVNRDQDGSPKAYSQNGRWFYWVTLPVDAVWTFEIDDANVNVVTPFTGLLLSLLDLGDYENIQKNLSMNPLVSMLHGEIEYSDEKNAADPYKLSPDGQALFTTLFYNMLEANNTGGIGLYMAPLKNIKLEQLAEAPNGMTIASNAIKQNIGKAGLSALIPSDTDARAGVANISYGLESQFAKPIYDQIMRLVDYWLDSLNLMCDMRFVMFGDLESDERELKSIKEGLTLGILPEVFRYNALRGLTVLDDECMSDMVMELGLNDKRIPLISSYSAKNENGLPPQIGNKGGRPTNDETGAEMSEGAENDRDSITVR